MKFTLTFHDMTVTELEDLLSQLKPGPIEKPPFVSQIQEAVDEGAQAAMRAQDFPHGPPAPLSEELQKSIESLAGEKQEAEPEAPPTNKGRPKKKFKYPPPLTAKPDKTAKTEPEPEPESEPEPKPEPKAARKNGLDLEGLKSAMTNAVRRVRNGEGDSVDEAINAALPEFKQRTGLPFVMNASTEDHAIVISQILVKAGFKGV